MVIPSTLGGSYHEMVIFRMLVVLTGVEGALVGDFVSGFFEGEGC